MRCELFVSMLLLSASHEHRVLDVLKDVMPRGGLKGKSDSQARKFTFGTPDGLVVFQGAPIDADVYVSGLLSAL